MKDTTNEFSFVLKPSSYGVGVFAVHGIKKGTHLRLFTNSTEGVNHVRRLKKENIPEAFLDFCVDRGDEMACPDDFGQMSLGWYMNHSMIGANVEHKNPANEAYQWYASRDIQEGEEILINYNTLEEPEDSREGYYKK